MLYQITLLISRCISVLTDLAPWAQEALCGFMVSMPTSSFNKVAMEAIVGCVLCDVAIQLSTHSLNCLLRDLEVLR